MKSFDNCDDFFKIYDIVAERIQRDNLFYSPVPVLDIINYYLNSDIQVCQNSVKSFEISIQGQWVVVNPCAEFDTSPFTFLRELLEYIRVYACGYGFKDM